MSPPKVCRGKWGEHMGGIGIKLILRVQGLNTDTAQCELALWHAWLLQLVVLFKQTSCTPTHIHTPTSTSTHTKLHHISTCAHPQSHPHALDLPTYMYIHTTHTYTDMHIQLHTRIHACTHHNSLLTCTSCMITASTCRALPQAMQS